MTRLELLAIRQLPAKYVRDGTIIGSVEAFCAGQTSRGLVASHPNLPMIRWLRNRRWKRVTTPVLPSDGWITLAVWDSTKKTYVPAPVPAPRTRP